MFSKHERVYVLFDDGHKLEGTIQACPGDKVIIYGNEETLGEDQYRVIYFNEGYGFPATIPVDRLIKYA